LPSSSPLWIEIVTRHGHLLQRHRFERDEVRIGRGYDNDLILDDPLIAQRPAPKALGVQKPYLLRIERTKQRDGCQRFDLSAHAVSPGAPA